MADLAELADAFDYLSVDPSTFSDVGTRLRFRISGKDDLAVTVLKSDSAEVRLPDADLEEPSGTGKYCSVGDLLEEMLSSLEKTESYIPPGAPAMKFRAIVEGLSAVTRGEGEGTLVLDDPLSRSRIESDKVVAETYTRSWEQNDEFGCTARFVVEDQKTGEEGAAMAADLIKKANKIVAITGAGLSTASGIPAFRSGSGAIFDRYDEATELYSNFLASEEKRRRYWDLSLHLYSHIVAAAPNPAHDFFVHLHEQGKLHMVVTQNIDRLHQIAGVPYDKVIELHGNTREIVCVSCGALLDTEATYAAAKADGIPPNCACGGLVKPRTISFGQPLEPGILAGASKAVDEADLLIIVGTALVVEPANKLPGRAIAAGVPVIIVNMGETKYDPYAVVHLKDPAVDALAAVRKH